MEIRTRKEDGVNWHYVYRSAQDPDGLYIAAIRHSKREAVRFMKEHAEMYRMTDSAISGLSTTEKQDG